MKPIQSMMLLCILFCATTVVADNITIYYSGGARERYLYPKSQGAPDQHVPVYVTLVQAKSGDLYPNMKIKGLGSEDYAQIYEISAWTKVQVPRPSWVLSDRSVNTYLIVSTNKDDLLAVFKQGNVRKFNDASGAMSKIGQISREIFIEYNANRKRASFTSFKDVAKQYGSGGGYFADRKALSRNDWNSEVVTATDVTTVKRNELPQDMFKKEVFTSTQSKINWNKVVQHLQGIHKLQKAGTTDGVEALEKALEKEGVKLERGAYGLVLEPQAPRGSAAAQLLNKINDKVGLLKSRTEYQ